MIDEANEDIDGRVDTLTKMGVKVHRPLIGTKSLSYWSSKGWYSWCPRDWFHLTMLIETPLQDSDNMKPDV